MNRFALLLNGPNVRVRPFSDRFLTLALSLALLSVMLSVPVMTGCSSAQALADVQKFEPVIVNALVLACTIDSGAPICGTGEAQIQSDYNLLVKVWTDYNAAVAAGTATVAAWNYLNAVFSTFEADSAAIFALASGLNAPEITAVVAAAQVLLAGIEALFPDAPAGASTAKSTLFSGYAAKRSTNYDSVWLSGWVKDYNAKLDVAKVAHPKAKLKKVHVHSLALRVASLGWEK
jgi:hypothetical protein